MKVLYLVEGFPVISETFIVNEILEVQRQGIEVDLFAFRRINDKMHPQVQNIKGLHYFADRRVINIYALYGHLYWMVKKPKTYLKILFLSLYSPSGLIRRFIRHLYEVAIINRSNPDHIHAHFGARPSDVAMLTHLFTGIPYTFTTHGFDLFERPPRNYRLKSKLSKKHIAVSQYNKTYLVEVFGVDPNKIEVVHCGIDLQCVLPARRRTKSNIIVCIARLERVKGVDYLIEACKILKERRITFKCLIVGDGPERGALVKLIETLGLNNEVRLLGDKTHDKVFRILACATIKVLSSRSESMGVALMEAMIMGVPVIAPNVRGVCELVEDGKCGFLVASGDVGMIAERMIQLLTDGKLRASFVAEGYRKIHEHFNLQIEAAKLIEIWRQQ